MASFVILLTARTARMACSDRHTYIQTDKQTHTHETTTVTLSAHARRGLVMLHFVQVNAFIKYRWDKNVCNAYGGDVLADPCVSGPNGVLP